MRFPGRSVVVATCFCAASPALAQEPGAIPEAYSGPAWSPYLAGGLIGILSMLTFYFSNKPLGASTAYARIAGMIGLAVVPKHTLSLKFYAEKKPAVDWEVMLLGGVVVGAFAAAFLGNELTLRWVPPMWEARFGESVGLRLVAAFAGGVLMAFGSRLAGGCTSGHGISGTMQLAVGSWIAVICFFVAGIATAMVMYRV